MLNQSSLKVRLWVLMRDQTLTRLSPDFSLIPKLLEGTMSQILYLRFSLNFMIKHGKLCILWKPHFLDYIKFDLRHKKKSETWFPS